MDAAEWQLGGYHIFVHSMDLTAWVHLSRPRTVFHCSYKAFVGFFSFQTLKWSKSQVLDLEEQLCLLVRTP